MARPVPCLLTIPLEIRLQIYSYVLHSHPVHHAHLSPLVATSNLPPYATEELHHTTFTTQTNQQGFGTGLTYPSTHPCVATTFISAPEDDNLFTTPKAIVDIKSMPTALCPSRSVMHGKIPTGLLATCKQIYNETYLIPFHTNTFTFVNWFWSGVYASRQFTRGLKSWQSEGIRWPSVEVLGRDLWIGADSTGPAIGGDEPKKGDWWDLCSMWKGVWGLKLAIKGNATLSPYRMKGVLCASDGDKSYDKNLLDAKLEWVQEGLLLLHQLKWIEIEIEDESLNRAVKLEFCQELARMLNEKRKRKDGWTGDVKVVFVEKIRVEQSDKEFKWCGGAPPELDLRSNGFF